MADVSKLQIGSNGTVYTIRDDSAVHTVDSSLSSSSTNPVQNKVIKAELDKKENVVNLGTLTLTSLGTGSYSVSGIASADVTAINAMSAPYDVAFSATVGTSNISFCGTYSGDETINGGTYHVYVGEIKDSYNDTKLFTFSILSTGTTGLLNLLEYAKLSELATVATTGDYEDLTNKPSYTASGLAASKTITALSQTDGTISATASDIQIRPVQVKVGSSGDEAQVENNDVLPIFDSNDGEKLKRSNLQFDTSNSTDFLRKDGTFATPPNNNTTYTFADGTNSFTVTPSGGTAQTVNVTPSITNNVTGTGASGYLAQFDGTNTITSGPQLGSSTTTYLRNDGTFTEPNRDDYYVAGTNSIAAVTSSPYYAARWKGTNSSITSLYTGLSINFKLDVAGNGSYGVVLDLNGWGEHPVCANVSTMIGTRYAVGCIIHLVYDADQSANVYRNSSSASSVSGCWKLADYDSTLPYRIQMYYTIAKPSTSLYRYELCTSLRDGTILPANVVSNKATTYTKALTTTYWDPFAPIYYYASTTIVSAGDAVAAGTLYRQYLMDARYSFNINSSGTAGSTALTASSPVYIKARYNKATYLAKYEQDTSSANYLTRSSLVQSLPSTDPNTSLPSGEMYIYILLGYAYNKYQIELTSEHQVYYWDSANSTMSVFEGVLPAASVSVGTLNTDNSTAQTVSSSESFGGNISLHKVAKTGTYSDLIGTPSLATVATSGSYNDLTNKPSIPTVGTLNTTNTTAQSTSASESLGGAVNLHKIAKTGTYSDLIGTPSLATVATSGSYNDLTNKPTDANGIVPLANGGTGISADDTYDWYGNWDLHPHFEVYYAALLQRFSCYYRGPSFDSAITSLSEALDTNEVKYALRSPVPVWVTESGAYTFTGTIQKPQGESYIEILFPDGVSFGGSTVNGISGTLAYTTQDGLEVGSIAAHTPAWLSAFSGSMDTANDASRTITGLGFSGTSLAATTSPIAITSDQVTANSTAATIATGDTLIVGDSSNSNKLAKTSISFDTTNTTNFLRKDGTWASPASYYTGTIGSQVSGSIFSPVTLSGGATYATLLADISAHKPIVVELEYTDGESYYYYVLSYSGTSTKTLDYTIELFTSGDTRMGGASSVVEMLLDASGGLLFNDAFGINSALIFAKTQSIYGAGASDSLAKFNADNTITSGPALGSDTTTFLRNDGQWAVPSGGAGTITDVQVNNTSVVTNGVANIDTTGLFPKTGGEITGDVTLLKSGTTPGDSYSLIFQRGTLTDAYNDWRLQDRGGYLYFDQRGSNSTTWSDQVMFNTSGGITATSFSGSGASLTSLNASNISSGTLNAARLPSGLEYTSNKVTSISSSSTDDQYASAKCTYDAVNAKENKGKITISGTEYTVSRQALTITDGNTTTTYYVAVLTT